MVGGMPSHLDASGTPFHHQAEAASLLPRICVRPPYFALRDVAVDGLWLTATVSAESPAHGEVGPMPAAEIGRHAAIAGLLHGASIQRDEVRRYYLARQATCRYRAHPAPYGTPLRLRSEVIDLEKRAVHARVEASVGDDLVATFDLRYAILTAPAFERLFRTHAAPTPNAPNPYGRLLDETFVRTEDAIEQAIDALPVGACVGHFDGYPALPVAVLMGQLSYLAGRLFVGTRSSDTATPYRVTRGEIEADDLAWAGERARFRVVRDGVDEEGDRFRCTVEAGDRTVGAMTLWLTAVV
jgi:hypothetical protein